MATNSVNNQSSYLAFDGTSIRDIIINRLNEGQVFTDQNYQGSNLSALIDVISYSFSTLLYYLNKTSSESLFSDTQIYENMNRIVKLLNYNPLGRLSQNVNYSIYTSNFLPEGNFIIPKYSYINVGGTNFSFPDDISFTNTLNGVLQLNSPSTDFFLYQGNFKEYPLYTAIGSNNEVLYLTLGDNVYIDHFNVNVYVQPLSSQKWEKWSKTENLFLNKSTDSSYEIRFNQNKNYEIKFGNDINGKKLNTGDKVLVYYLNIDPNSLQISPNALSSTNITLYNSVLYSQIQNDIPNQDGTLLDNSNLPYVFLNNTYPSNPYQSEETVDDIRNNAAKNFSYQQRLVTTSDFQNYIESNYKNIVSTAYVASNDDYLAGHIKYLYNIGISSPQLDNIVLYNQINFANTCNFNNIYTYLVPSNNSQSYLNSAQKELILNDLNKQKIMTSEIVPMDPVYMMMDFYVKSEFSDPTINDLNLNYLLVLKTPNARQSDSGILNSIINIFKNAFSNVKLGQHVDVNKIASDIVNLDSVQNIQTYRSDTNSYINGLSFLVWNMTYPTLDISVHNHSFNLNYFQYPLLNSIKNLINKIKIINSTGIISVTDF